MGINIPHLLILLAIVLVLFGTKKLRNLGSDLGGAINGFRKAMKEEEQPALKEVSEDKSPSSPIENGTANKQPQP